MNAPSRVQRLLHRAACLTLALLPVSIAGAQAPGWYHGTNEMPPGAIAQRQLMRTRPLAGYYQPVLVRGPQGSLLSIAAEGQFTPAQPGAVRAGLLIGPVYRLKVGNIPGREGHEVYPTIELLDRLYPPPGQAINFPIPIELTAEELQLAADGHFVTRVIYLENPETALPVQSDPRHQRWFEIRAEQDALEVADQFGRPVAILRMGSRTPDANFMFPQGTPPLVQYPPPQPSDARQPPAGAAEQPPSPAPAERRPMSPEEAVQSLSAPQRTDVPQHPHPRYGTGR